MIPIAYVALALGLVVRAGTAGAAVPSKAQEHCVMAPNRASARLAKMTGTNFLRCVKDAAGGKLPPGQICEQCLTADPEGTIARGEAYVTVAGARSCTVPPELGTTTAADVNDAFAAPHGVPEVFGPSLDGTVGP